MSLGLFKNVINKMCLQIYIYVYIYLYWPIGLMSRVFASSLGDQVSSPGRVILKTQKNGT